MGNDLAHALGDQRPTTSSRVSTKSMFTPGASALTGGVAAAIPNAVFHATGRRIRQLPITPELVMDPGDTVTV